MPTRLHRSGGGLPGVFCMPAMHAGRLIEADCLSAVVPEPEWRMVRAVAVDVAERAAFTGYASDRFGAWELCAQRQLLGPWPPGAALVLLSVLHRHTVLTRLLAWVQPEPEFDDGLPRARQSQS